MRARSSRSAARRARARSRSPPPDNDMDNDLSDHSSNSIPLTSDILSDMYSDLDEKALHETEEDRRNTRRAIQRSLQGQIKMSNQDDPHLLSDEGKGPVTMGMGGPTAGRPVEPEYGMNAQRQAYPIWRKEMSMLYKQAKDISKVPVFCYPRDDSFWMRPAIHVLSSIPIGVRLDDCMVVAVIKMMSNRKERHQSWPTEFDREGNPRPTRTKVGPPPVIRYQGKRYFLIYQRYIAMLGGDVDGTQYPVTYAGTVKNQKQLAKQDSSLLSFGALEVPDGVTTPMEWDASTASQAEHDGNAERTPPLPGRRLAWEETKTKREVFVPDLSGQPGRDESSGQKDKATDTQADAIPTARSPKGKLPAGGTRTASSKRKVSRASLGLGLASSSAMAAIGPPETLTPPADTTTSASGWEMSGGLGGSDRALASFQDTFGTVRSADEDDSPSPSEKSAQEVSTVPSAQETKPFITIDDSPDESKRQKASESLARQGIPAARKRTADAKNDSPAKRARPEPNPEMSLEAERKLICADVDRRLDKVETANRQRNDEYQALESQQADLQRRIDELEIEKTKLQKTDLDQLPDEMSRILSHALSLRAKKKERAALCYEDAVRTRWEKCMAAEDAHMAGTYELFKQLGERHPVLLKQSAPRMIGEKVLTAERQKVLKDNEKVKELEDGRFIYMISKKHTPPKYVEMSTAMVLGKRLLRMLDDKHTNAKWAEKEWLNEKGQLWETGLVHQLETFSDMRIVVPQRYQDGESDYPKIIETIGQLPRVDQLGRPWKRRGRKFMSILLAGQKVLIRPLYENGKPKQQEVERMTLMGPFYDQHENLLPGEGICTTIEREFRSYENVASLNIPPTDKWSGSPFPRALYTAVTAARDQSYNATQTIDLNSWGRVKIYDFDRNAPHKKLRTIRVPHLHSDWQGCGQAFVQVETLYLENIRLLWVHPESFRDALQKGRFLNDEGERSLFADVAVLLDNRLDRVLRCLPEDKVIQVVKAEEDDVKDELR